MKKRILSLVLCAAMLLSMCLFLGAGVMDDTTADGSAETTESYIPAVNFTNVAPFGPAVTGVSPLRARSVPPLGLDDSTTGSDNGMVINKTATANSNGTYTIQLEAYATGSKVITEVKEDIPTDIVLVLDQSGSMADCIVCGGEMDGDNDQHPTGYQKVSKSDISRDRTYYVIVDGSYQKVTWHDGDWVIGWGWYDDNGVERDPNSYAFYQATGYEACTSRLSALKTALNNFTAAVRTKALGTDGQAGTDDDVDHRIAMVGFASGYYYENGWNSDYYYYGNTEVFVGASQYTYNAGSANNASNASSAQSHYSDAFQDMDTTQGQTNITASIGALDANGGTLINLGMEMANGILNANPVQNGEKRNRVIIVFTDGTPGWSGYDSDTASAAISQASTAKGNGVTVYSVGVFSGADATSAGSSSGTDTQKANWFMQNLSSNDGVVKNPSYYLSAADADTLKNIFKQISDQIESGGSSSTLTGEAVVKDIISPQFQLPEGTTVNDINLETYACTGKTGDTYTWSENNDTMGARATVENDTVSVTGFDFAGNWCGMEKQTDGSEVLHRGNKLVISFKVEPKAGFLGGNNVYTNDNAAIYESSTAQTPVVTFKERPQVNVPIKPVTVTAQEKNVYLLGNLTANQLRSGATVKVGDVSLDLSQENYGLAAWQTDYVDIEVTITDKAGKDVSTDGLSSLKDDTTYTVTVKVSPKETATDTTTSGAEATVQTGRSNEANVNVYKPELTYKDSEGYYGDTAPDFAGNLTNTVWKHDETEAPDSMGTEPTLTLTYTPEADKIAGDKINTRTDVGVAVAVMINETPVTDSVRFKHTDCAGTTCTVPADCKFVLHVKTCSLTISKTVTGKGADPNQTFVFNVMKDGKAVTTVVLKANTSTTITGLAVGTYTVTEDTNWSWSYTIHEGDQNKKVTLDKDNGYDCEAKITNTAKENHWLTSIVDVINKWTSSTTIEKTNVPNK